MILDDQHCFRAGTTARIRIALTSDDEFYTPTVPPSVTIFDPSGAQVATGSAVAWIGNNHWNYFYDYQIASGAVEGEYEGFVNFVDDLGNPCGSPKEVLLYVQPN